MSLLDTGPVMVSARRAQRAEAIGAVLRSTTTVLIYGFALLMVLGEFGINLGPLIAGAGILGVALGLTNYLVDIELPEKAVAWATQAIQSKELFLLALNVLLLAAGCVMDVFSAIVVLAPILVPIGIAFGIDPVHMGVIFLANLELGYLTPPVGVNLFYASSRFNKPISEVCRAVAPLFLPLAAGVLLVAIAAAGCDPTIYRNSATPAPGYGNAVNQNLAVTIIDPQPATAADTDIDLDGRKGAIAIERYRQGQVIPPEELRTSEISGE